MKYSLLEFEYGYEGQFYQEVDQSGNVKFFDLNCNHLELIPSYGYFVVEDNIPKPNCFTE